MLVKQKHVKKADVTYVTATDTAQEALQKLNESGFRCIPVLDETKTKFIGNVYKVTLLEYFVEHGNLDVVVEQLCEDHDRFIYEESSFYEVFHSIKMLPYLAVLDENENFSGIMTHAKVFELLEEAWGYKTGSCALTIALPDAEGILINVLSTIKKHATVHCIFSLDNDSAYLRRVIVTLEKPATANTVSKIERNLSKVGARIIDTEIFDEESFYN
jgi:CBS domain-containing protein